MRRPKWMPNPTVCCVIALIAITASLFAYSVEVRRPWFGTVSNSLETWLNTGTMLWAKHWYREGPVKLRFGFFWNPDSIEFPTPASRDMYSSYPPGAVMPIYALGKILRREPTVSMIMAYSLANHFAVALVLALLVFYLARRLGWNNFGALAFGSIPPCCVLFLPSPATQFQMAHIHVVVLFPFVACVLLEFLRDGTTRPGMRRAIAVLQAALVFYGMLCDWLFAFVAFCLYVKRFAGGEILPFERGNLKRTLMLFVARSVRFWAPVAAALGMFAATLYHFDRFGVIAERFEERAAVRSGRFLGVVIDTFFWRHHMVRGYGAIGKYLVLTSAAVLLLLGAYVAYRQLRRRSPNNALRLTVSAMFLLLAPCLLHVYVFRQDSAHFLHYFTTAKFAVPIAMIPFALLPAGLLAALRWNRAEASLVFLAAALLYVRAEAPRAKEQFLPPPTTDPTAPFRFLAENTAYEDVVFAPNSLLAVDAVPMWLAYSMKRVYVASSVQAIYAKVAPVEGEYVVDYFAREGDPGLAHPDIRRLLQAACAHKVSEGVALYKIRKADFLALCRDLGIAS